MKAIVFFAMLNKAKEKAERLKAEMGAILCDATSISLGDSNYYTEMRQTYADMAKGVNLREAQEKRALDPRAESTRQIFESITMEASRLN